MPHRREAGAPCRPKPALQRGMTLIELMIVFAIISILAAISVPLFLGVKDKAIWGAARANIAVIRTALSVYAANQDSNRYPSSLAWTDVSTSAGILHFALLPADKYDARLSDFTYTPDATFGSYVIVGTVFDKSGDTISATPSGISPNEYPH
jgi:prepilin-type N-terminal cleavage/methylation domain-containing protein